MVDSQTIGILVPAVSVSIAAIYYIITLHNNNTNRQAQLYMSIYKDFTSEWMANTYFDTMNIPYSNYQDFMKKRRDDRLRGDSSDWEKVVRMIGWLDGIGILVKRKLIDESLAFETMGGSVLYQWAKWRDVVDGMAEEGRNNPSFWGGFRYLAGRMEELMRVRDGGWKPRLSMDTHQYE